MPTLLDYISPPSQTNTLGLSDVYHFTQDKTMNDLL